MNITNYIVEFLKNENDVEIPGIGTLRLKTTGAKYHEDSGDFIPAKRTIEFAQEFNQNEKIVDFIASKECISNDTATRMWRNYVLALQEKLQKEGVHPFDNLGSLVLQKDAELVFQTNPDLNLLENNFGLHSLSGLKKITPAPLQENPFDYHIDPIQFQKAKEVSAQGEVKPSTDEDGSEILQRIRAIVSKLEEKPSPREEVIPSMEAEKEFFEEKVEEPTQENVQELISETEVHDQVEKTIDIEDAVSRTIEEDVREVELESLVSEQVERREEEVSLHEVQQVTDSHAVQAPLSAKAEEKKSKEPRKKLEKPRESGKRLFSWKYIVAAIFCLLVIGGAAYQYFYQGAVCPLKFFGSNKSTEKLNVEPKVEDYHPIPDVDTVQTVIQEEKSENLPAGVEQQPKEVTQDKAASTLAQEMPGEATISSKPIKNDAQPTQSTQSSTTEVTNQSLKAELKSTKPVNKKPATYSPIQFYPIEMRYLAEAELIAEANLELFSAMGLFFMEEMTTEQARVYWENKGSGIEQERKMAYQNEQKRLAEQRERERLAAMPKPKARRDFKIVVVKQPKSGFDLINGFFKVRENAVNQADILAQKGLNPYVIEVLRNGSTFYYVSLGNRPTYTEIESLMANYQRYKDVEMVIRRW